MRHHYPAGVLLLVALVLAGPAFCLGACSGLLRPPDPPGIDRADAVYGQPW